MTQSSVEGVPPATTTYLGANGGRTAIGPAKIVGMILRDATEVVDEVERAIRASPVATRALRAARAAGAHAFVVGGAVRDALLGRTPKDLDIECHDIGHDALAHALRSVATVLEVGQSFGVLKVVADSGDTIDFSSPRRERSTGRGHRSFDMHVAADIGIEAAAARRDFTMNAMAVDLDARQLHDPFHGAADLRAGVLRHVSDAFSEDPLRVLRGARFAARFDLAMHPDTVAKCAAMVDEFADLPASRVWGELAAVFRTADHPSRMVEVLVQTGWIAHFPEFVAITGVPQDPRWHPEGTVEVHSALAADAAVAVARRDGLDDAERELVVCAALLHDLGKATHTQIRADGRITAHGHAEAGVEPAHRFLRRIGAPHDLERRVLPLVREHMCCASTTHPTRAAVRRLSRRLAPATIREWAWLVEADHRGRGPVGGEGCAGPWLALAEEVGVHLEPTVPLLRGAHLVARGLVPGPTFKPVLEAAMRAQEAGEFDDEPGALAWLDAHLG